MSVTVQAPKVGEHNLIKLNDKCTLNEKKQAMQSIYKDVHVTGNKKDNID